MAKNIKISSEHCSTDLTSIAKTVNPLLRQLLGDNGMIFLELTEAWNQIIGQDIAPYCLPQRISFKKNERTDGCLQIQVLSGAFAMEIGQKQQQIIEKVNSFFGYPAISKLKIIQSGNPENFLISKKSTDKVKKSVVTEEEESYITELIKDIDNKELRQSLEKIGKAVFSNKNRQE